MRKLLLLVVAPLSLVALPSCQTGVTMWASCSNARGVDPTGTDGHFVLVCKHGTWTPLMTVGEYLRIRRGEPVVIAPLPTEPTTTTTTSTTSTTAPGSTSTTSSSSTTSTSTTSSTTTSTTSTTLAPTPGITGLSPNTGPAAGGTSVTITGTDLAGTTAVTFGGIAVTSFTVDSATQVTVVTPAHAVGQTSVVVTTSAGSGSQINAYTYT